jgi:hypothetical protein
MTYVPLKVVSENLPDTVSGAALYERIQHLRAETRSLVLEHVGRLQESLLRTQQIADEVADGGDVYPPGVRELACRLRETAAAKAQTLAAIMARS